MELRKPGLRALVAFAGAFALALGAAGCPGESSDGSGTPEGASADDTEAAPAPQTDAGANPATAGPSRDASGASATPEDPPAPDVTETAGVKVEKGYEEFRLDGVCVALSGDGLWLAAGDLGGRVTLWNTKTGRLLIQDTLPEGNRVREVGFARAAPVMVSGAFQAPDAPFRVWQMEPAGFRHTLGSLHWQVRQLALDDAGQRLLGFVDVGNEAGRVVVWGIDGGEVLLAASHDGEGFVSMSGDGRTVALSSMDGTLWVWRPKADAPDGALELVANKRFESAATLQRLLLSRDGRTLWGAAENQVFHYTLDGPPALVRSVTIGAPGAVIRGLELLPDGRAVAVTRPKAGGVRLWDVEDGHLRVNADGGCRCEDYALSADGKTLACDCVPEAAIRLWRLPEGP